MSNLSSASLITMIKKYKKYIQLKQPYAVCTTLQPQLAANDIRSG